MDCYQHPGAASTATCVGCARPICDECREEVAGHPMCGACLSAATARLAAEPATAIVAPASAPAAPVAADLPATAETPWIAATAAVEPVAGLPAAPRKEFVRPGVMRRILRGMLWGAVYGQWWTLWTVLSLFMWGHGSLDANLVAFAADRFIFYGFFGSVAGIIIGAVNAPMATGRAIGIGVGVAVCLLEMFLDHSGLEIINLVFFFFTGQYVGLGTTWRVQQPVARQAGRGSD